MINLFKCFFVESQCSRQHQRNDNTALSSK